MPTNNDTQPPLSAYQQWVQEMPAPGVCEQCGLDLRTIPGDGPPGLRYAIFIGDRNNDYGWYCSYECAIDHCNVERALAGAEHDYPES